MLAVECTVLLSAACVVRIGFYASAKELVGWPITPGFDFSGVVSKTGKNVENFSPGDKVFGITLFDAYATHVVVPQDQIFPIPDKISYEEAAGFPTVFLTAYYALYLLAVIHSGSTILIHSAAGGVGSALLQLCRQAGWRSIGVVGGSHKVEAAKAMGADKVIDKSKEDLWKMVEAYAPKGCDVIMDGNGFLTLKDGYKHLAPGGKLISYGFHSMFPRRGGKPNKIKLMLGYFRTPKFNPLNLATRNRSVLAFNLSFMLDRKDLLLEAMQNMLSWLTADSIQVPPVSTYPFDEVARAHSDLESGKTIGKLILIP